MHRISVHGLWAFCLLFLLTNYSLAQDSEPQSSDAPKTVVPLAQDQDQQKATRDVHKLRPQYPTDELLEMSEAALQKGFDYLVKSQNEDGSWGSHDPKIANLSNFGFQLRNRGSQDAVRTACTAICAEALLYQPNRTEEQETALDKAIKELSREVEFEFHPGETFASWGYGYKLGFLVELHNSPFADKLDEKQLMAAGQSCVDGLVDLTQADGGWGYYSGVMKDFQSMSFNTAFFALSLKRAKEMGIDVPEGLVVDASKIVDRVRAPDGTIGYDARFTHNRSTVLSNLGAGSRTISSTWALKELGFYGEADMDKAMQVFENGENYLEQGRKLIQPHSAVHQISGYFFFFGYNYATEAAAQMGDKLSQKRWDRFGWTMLRTQEDDGRWWDTPAGEYGDKWGTGFALLTLQRYVTETKRRIAMEKFSDRANQDAGNKDPQSDDKSKPKEGPASETGSEKDDDNSSF